MRHYLLLILTIGSFHLHAQTIFPDLSGEELADALRAEFRPNTVLTYGQARDTLWSKIDNRGDSLFGVYSGFGVELDPNADPTQDAFAKGINAEHTYPRAFGAEFGNAQADMHNLFPTRSEVNADRGNLPFGEILDFQTDDWYYLDNELSAAPSTNRDLYSERLQAGRFEPREDHKGNAARAMFYFYTIYRPEADGASPNWIDQQLNDLCDWHLNDPVDQRELERSIAIAPYQDGKENPFVVDCSLVRRAYCPDLPQQQCLTSTGEVVNSAGALIKIIGSYPNAHHKILTVEILRPLELEVRWYDLLGRELSRQNWAQVDLGQFDLRLRTPPSQGPVLARLRARNSNGRWVEQSVIVP